MCLLPIGLCSKRRFSRKYPICLVLPKPPGNDAKSSNLPGGLLDVSVRNLCVSVADLLPTPGDRSTGSVFWSADTVNRLQEWSRSCFLRRTQS